MAMATKRGHAIRVAPAGQEKGEQLDSSRHLAQQSKHGCKPSLGQEKEKTVPGRTKALTEGHASRRRTLKPRFCAFCPVSRCEELGWKGAVMPELPTTTSRHQTKQLANTFVFPSAEHVPVSIVSRLAQQQGVGKGETPSEVLPYRHDPSPFREDSSRPGFLRKTRL